MDTQFAELVRRSVGGVPFANLDACAQLFAVTFPPRPPAPSGGPFAVYESSASQGALVGRVELRANFPQRSSGQLALVQLARPLPLTKARLDALLKMTGTAMGPAMPHRPDASAYVTYSFKSAQLRVSYQDLTYTVVTGFAVDTFAQP